MERTANFRADRRRINTGMYISRVDGDIVTYDIRIAKPNGGEYLEMPVMHTIEHLLNAFMRNSEFGRGIVYVGAKASRTGFDLLTRGMSHVAVIKLVRDAFTYISKYDDRIPFCSEEECGNFKEHDLKGAREAVKPFLKAIENYTAEMLDYSCHIK